MTPPLLLSVPFLRKPNESASLILNEVLKPLLRFIEFLLAISVLGVSYGMNSAAIRTIQNGRWHSRFDIVWFGIGVVAYAGIRLLVNVIISARRDLADTDQVEGDANAESIPHS